MPPKFKKKKSRVKSPRQNEASKVKAATKVTPLGLISFYSFSSILLTLMYSSISVLVWLLNTHAQNAEKFENKLKPIAPFAPRETNTAVPHFMLLQFNCRNIRTL